MATDLEKTLELYKGALDIGQTPEEIADMLALGHGPTARGNKRMMDAFGRVSASRVFAPEEGILPALGRDFSNLGRAAYNSLGGVRDWLFGGESEEIPLITKQNPNPRQGTPAGSTGGGMSIEQMMQELGVGGVNTGEKHGPRRPMDIKAILSAADESGETPMFSVEGNDVEFTGESGGNFSRASGPGFVTPKEEEEEKLLRAAQAMQAQRNQEIMKELVGAENPDLALQAIMDYRLMNDSGPGLEQMIEMLKRFARREIGEDYQDENSGALLARLLERASQRR